VLGEFELVFGAFKDNLRKREAESVVGLFEDGASGGVRFGQIVAHAHGLRTLAGEEERNLGDDGFGAHEDSLATRPRAVPLALKFLWP
jgi:hypothetical protein